MSYSRPSRQVALALMAHPDDAEILCAGTLIRLADASWEIHIATATAGDCGSSTLPAHEIADIRRKEARAAAQCLGATYHCLEEHDVNVFFDKATNSKTIDLLREIAPSLVFTHPRYDYMLDHEQVHLLARSATFSYPVPNASSLPLQEGSAVPWLYFCDPLEGRDPYTKGLVSATNRIDITTEMPRKVEMLGCHKSQREWLRNHHGMDEYIDAMTNHAVMRGSEIGVAYAEAFVQYTGHAYPQSNLLNELFGGR